MGTNAYPPVIASEAKQSIYPHAEAWIASSLRSSQSRERGTIDGIAGAGLELRPALIYLK
jgi:hypothetical protein